MLGRSWMPGQPNSGSMLLTTELVPDLGLGSMTHNTALHLPYLSLISPMSVNAKEPK